jgi:hypothetical protein
MQQNVNALITHYAFYDDEVDYTNIQKYGRVVGKEKIEKNTPIFEASTSAAQGCKHELIRDGISGNNSNQSNLAYTGIVPIVLTATSNTVFETSNPQTVTITIQADPAYVGNANLGYPGNIQVSYNSNFITVSNPGSIDAGQSSTSVSVSVNPNGKNLTQYLQSNQVVVPVTFTGRYGYSKVIYITASYQ